MIRLNDSGVVFNKENHTITWRAKNSPASRALFSVSSFQTSMTTFLKK